MIEKLLCKQRVLEMKSFSCHYKFNQFRSRASKTFASLAESRPTIFRTSFFSTVASCALIPDVTFNPVARHSLSGKSVFARTDEIGTRNRSFPFLPMTTAGRTLRLVKSGDGIGRRKTP